VTALGAGLRPAPNGSDLADTTSYLEVPLRIELLPVLLGIVVGVIGAALLADAFTPDYAFTDRERRRRPRAPRHRGGEAALGAGVLAVAAALIGRDTWRYSTVAVLVALVLLAFGVAMNWRWLGGFMLGPVDAAEASGEEGGQGLAFTERRKTPRKSAR
jgi:hypothetical protein